MNASRETLIPMLQKAYAMEIETVMNYLANSINPDGVRAELIKQSLADDVTEELGHARKLGERIKQLEGHVLGSASVSVGDQRQPPEDTTDVVSVIQGVIEAEEAACDQYNNIIRAAEGVDYVTQDLCINLLADEEEHLILFRGFLKEYERERQESEAAQLVGAHPH